MVTGKGPVCRSRAPTDTNGYITVVKVYVRPVWKPVWGPVWSVPVPVAMYNEELNRYGDRFRSSRFSDR